MIRYLRIRNLAIIREVSLDLSPGFTVITGETGAGKSILVDSLALLMGERAGPDRIRSGESACAVEAVFDLSRQESLLPFLEERGWAPGDGELILRREIQPGGRGRAFVGSHLASLSDLRELGERLLDLHGQHEHQALLRPAEHLSILDRYCGHEKALEEMGTLHSEIRRVRDRLEVLHRDRQEIARRADILRFQVEEIDRAGVRPGEAEALRVERGRVRNLEKIRELALSCAGAALRGGGSGDVRTWTGRSPAPGTWPGSTLPWPRLSRGPRRPGWRWRSWRNRCGRRAGSGTRTRRGWRRSRRGWPCWSRWPGSTAPGNRLSWSSATGRRGSWRT